MTVHTADIAVIGGGIAGFSLAAALAGRASVVLLEAEARTFHHTSSRSAAQMQPTYGPPEIRALTAATLRLIPEIESELSRSLLTSRALIWCEFVGGSGLQRLLDDVPGIVSGSIGEAVDRLPALVPDRLQRVAYDENAKEVDVASLLSYYQATALRQGTRLVTGARVHHAERLAEGWALRAGDEIVHAGVVVNAAGAWADTVASGFGLPTKGLTPYRRTVTIARPTGRDVVPGWPMAADVGGSFYFRVEGSSILASPMEDRASEPEDAAPRRRDVARVKSRINQVTDFALEVSERSWTGLRTMAADGLPVIGRDAQDERFYWLAGQSGYGIQTSAALGCMVAADLLGESSGLGEDANAAFGSIGPARASLDARSSSEVVAT